ncbi:hypothetical protein FOA52_012599 [Chlamydomonas sp. UWO 241]|nr:hypothetical protein FOA52_012599 [Chlamydomonas sp. UWO 241]
MWEQRGAWLQEEVAALAQERVHSPDLKRWGVNLLQLLFAGADACDRVLREKVESDVSLKAASEQVARLKTRCMQMEAAGVAAAAAANQEEVLTLKSKAVVMAQELTKVTAQAQGLSQQVQLLIKERDTAQQRADEMHAQVLELQDESAGRLEVLQTMMADTEGRATTSSSLSHDNVQLQAQCKTLTLNLETNAAVITKLIDLNTELMDGLNAAGARAARAEAAAAVAAGGGVYGGGGAHSSGGGGDGANGVLPRDAVAVSMFPPAAAAPPPHTRPPSSAHYAAAAPIALGAAAAPPHGYLFFVPPGAPPRPPPPPGASSSSYSNNPAPEAVPLGMAWPPPPLATTSQQQQQLRPPLATAPPPATASSAAAAAAGRGAGIPAAAAPSLASAFAAFMVDDATPRPRPLQPDASASGGGQQHHGSGSGSSGSSGGQPSPGGHTDRGVGGRVMGLFRYVAGSDASAPGVQRPGGGGGGGGAGGGAVLPA